MAYIKFRWKRIAMMVLYLVRRDHVGPVNRLKLSFLFELEVNLCKHTHLALFIFNFIMSIWRSDKWTRPISFLFII